MPNPPGSSGKDRRPVRSVLDSDLYKFTMQQAILLSSIEDPPVSYRFTNRSKNMTFTRDCFDQIQIAVDDLASLALTHEERKWLERRCPYFRTQYLDWLAAFRFRPTEQVFLRFVPTGRNSSQEEFGELEIEIKGIWSEVILYEVPLMSIVSELYFRTVDTKWDMQGQRALAKDKARRLTAAGIRYSEFGSRRRRSYDSHRICIEGLLAGEDEVISAPKQFPKPGKLLGTSNVHFAQVFDLTPIGTVAHEWTMAVSALCGYDHVNLRALQYWDSVYAPPAYQPESPSDDLTIALTDTFSSNVFFNDLLTTSEGQEIGRRWKGLRQDSGDSKAFARRAVEFYKTLGIDPKTKVVIFSDGLDVDKCIDLAKYSEEIGIGAGFGVGTTFTNDFRVTTDTAVQANPDALPRIGEVSKPLNIVIKLSKVKDKHAVKISDELTKNTGDKDEVRLVKERFHLEEQNGTSSSTRSAPLPSAVRTPKSRLPALIFIVLVSILLRIFLFAMPGLTDILEDRLELNDPFSSWLSVLNTAWALQPPHNTATISPYSSKSSLLSAFDEAEGAIGPAGTTRAVPTPMLMLILSAFLPTNDGFRPLSHLNANTLVDLEPSALLFIILDVISTVLVYRIASLRLASPMLAESSTTRKIRSRLSARRLLLSLSTRGLRLLPDPALVSAGFSFHPLILATCLARSGTALTSTSLLFAVWGGMEGSAFLSALGISLSSLLALHPLLLLPAVVLLCTRQKRYWRHFKGRRVGKRKDDSVIDWLSPLSIFVVISTALATISAAFVAKSKGSTSERDWEGLALVYRGFLLLPSLSPSLSLWWYFFIEIFEHFRNFFLLVFNLHLLAWTAPICLRFRHDPLFAFFLLLGVQVIFKPYPTAGDVGLWTTFFLLFSEYSNYLRNPLVSSLLYLYSAFLIPSFSHLFLTLGSANANFLYAAGLVWSLGGISSWLDWAWAGGRLRWEIEREAGLIEIDEEEEEKKTTGEEISSEKVRSRGWKRAIVHS